MKKLWRALQNALGASARALDGADSLLRRGLDGGMGRWAALALWALASGLFYLVARGCRYEIVDTYPARDAAWMLSAIAALYTVLFSLTLLPLFYKLYRGRATPVRFVLMTGVWMATLLARIALLDYVSGDYEDFLSWWVYFMQDNGFVEAFARNIGDYTPPYMYLLYLVSRVPQLPDVYLIKFFSIGFDYMAAFFVMQLAGLKHKGLGAQLGFLMLGLWGPTVLLNGAYWAQCDIIYAGFLLGGLYFALADKPYRAVAFFGVAMALKLQAVFLMPMLLVLYGARKISLKHVLMFPLAFFAAMLPAIAAGKPIADIFEVYQAQMTNYPKLTLGALSIYQLLPETVSYRMFYNLGLQITLAVSVMFCGALYARGKRLTEGAILSAAMTLALAMPLLLPCMHERYFFVADVLGVAFFAHFPRKWYIPASVIFGSLVCYLVGLHAAPWRGMPMQVLTVLLAVMTGLCAAHTLRLARGAPCASDAQRV